MDVRKSIIVALCVFILAANVECIADEEPYTGTVYGLVDSDDAVDTIKFASYLGDYTDENYYGTLVIEIYLAGRHGRNKKIVKRHVNGCPVSDVVTTGNVGELVISEGGDVPNWNDDCYTYYYNYNSKMDDWFLTMMIEDGSVKRFPGIETIDGATIDKSDAESVLKRAPDSITKSREKLFEMGASWLSLYEDNKKRLTTEECDVSEIDAMIHNVSVTLGNVDLYNNIGYFMSMSERAHACSRLILEEVIKNVPTRKPAYLNLADLYASEGDIAKAREIYDKYVRMMNASGKSHKIPHREYSDKQSAPLN